MKRQLKIELLAVWTSMLILMPILRHVAIPPLPWSVCAQFAVLLCLSVSAFLILLDAL